MQSLAIRLLFVQKGTSVLGKEHNERPDVRNNLIFVGFFVHKKIKNIEKQTIIIFFFMLFSFQFISNFNENQ